MHALLGRKIADTQTGLAGFRRPAAAHTAAGSHGYEFELEMLLAAHQLSIPIVEEPIRTIYEPGKPVLALQPAGRFDEDLLRPLRFGSVSFMTAVLDNLVFYLAFRHTGHVLGRRFWAARRRWLQLLMSALVLLPAAAQEPCCRLPWCWCCERLGLLRWDSPAVRQGLNRLPPSC